MPSVVLIEIMNIKIVNITFWAAHFLDQEKCPH